jgi:uncharacterized membrane protein
MEKEKTKVGKFLQKIGRSDILETALGVVSDVASGDYLGAIHSLVRKDKEITPKDKEEINMLITLDYKDLINARDMQVAIATSKESSKLAKNFIYYLASFWSLVSVVYLFMITFVHIENVRAADTILGFLLGTIVATIIAYFFGSSKGSSDKMKGLMKQLKN